MIIAVGGTMPLGEDQDDLKTTLAVITTRLNYISTDVSRLGEQVSTLMPLPGQVVALVKDVERINVIVDRMRAQEADRRPAVQPIPTGTMAVLVLLVTVAAAVMLGAVYLGGRLGQ